jgi:penicillin-binding protein 1C
MYRRRIVYLLFSITALLAILAVMVLDWLFSDLPSLETLNEPLTTPSISITDRHRRRLYDVIADEGGRHTVVSLEVIPLNLQNATIAVEDSNFYNNPGVELRGILRALWINLRGGETLAGGSTITQQVARNLLLEAGERYQRTLRRKLRESLLAWRLTRNFHKDEILALYLNHMYYGAMTYGVEAAAQTYFGKSVAELDLAECTLLAGLPQAPSLYNPLTDPQAAKERQLIVLDLMEKQGMITHQEKTLASRERLVFVSSPYPVEAPHFVMMVRDQIDQILPPEALFTGGGLIVRTTLDLDWQHSAERIITRQLETLNEPTASGYGHRVGNTALVALDPHTGEIMALVGSPDYFEPAIDGAINMALAPRQPGSAIKPLIYAAAMDPALPEPWTVATMILDVHSAFVTHDGQAYAPVNFDRMEHGPVLLRNALGSSLNIPAVRTLDEIGMNAVFDLAADLGISTFGDPDRYDLSLALGGGEVRLVELVSSYASFANGGHRLTPSMILEISNSHGDILYVPDPPNHLQVLDPRLAWLISDILSDNNARMLGFGVNSALRIDRPAAVKTGTTTDFRDNWTIGYTPTIVVGVWVGNADNQPMFDVTGLSGAAPIWHQFIRTALAGEPEVPFERPDGLSQMEVCALSGQLPTDFCHYRITEWFMLGTEPTQFDTLHRNLIIDVDTGCLADDATPESREVRMTVLDLPPEAYPWARAQGLTLITDVACEGDVMDEAGEPDDVPLRLIAPDPSTIYNISPITPIDAQQIRLEAVGEAEFREVELWVDDEIVATLSNPPYQTWWSLSVGVHWASAVGITESGETVTSERIMFEVSDREP